MKKSLNRDEAYEPFLKTKRFDIFQHHVVRNPEQGLPRDLFTVWYRDEDVPRPVCEVVLFFSPIGNWVEWLHVCEEHRRQGIATEVMRALEKRFGKLTAVGATTAGIKFVAAYTKKKPVTKTTKTKVKRVTRKRN
jgi:GNAT superfamily N-acetyltransferase